MEDAPEEVGTVGDQAADTLPDVGTVGDQAVDALPDVGTVGDQAADTLPDISSEPKDLHLENAQLRLKLEEHDAKDAVRSHPWRRVAVALLVVVGCILLFAGNLTFWLKYTTLSSGGWVAAVGPLSQNEVVVDAVSVHLVNELFTELDVEQVTAELLPPDYSQIQGPLTALVRNLAMVATSTVMKSDEFNEVWTEVNRTVHGAAVEALRGEGSILSLQEGNLTLDLTDLFDSVQQTLGIPDLGILTDKDTQFVLFSSERLASLQGWVAAIDVMGILLPILTILTYAFAWWWSLFRRRTLQWIGIGIVVTMLLQLPLASILRPLVLAEVQDPMIKVIANEVWITVSRTLTQQTLLVMIVGLLITFGAWFAGPNLWATEARTDIHRWWADMRS